jgi:hypothetical protein
MSHTSSICVIDTLPNLRNLDKSPTINDSMSIFPTLLDGYIIYVAIASLVLNLILSLWLYHSSVVGGMEGWRMHVGNNMAA